MKRTDKEVLLQIFKKAGVEVLYEDANYFEIEPETYCENIGFEFSEEGKFQRII